jgi:hypothetical protein
MESPYPQADSPGWVDVDCPETVSADGESRYHIRMAYHPNWRGNGQGTLAVDCLTDDVPADELPVSDTDDRWEHYSFDCNVGDSGGYTYIELDLEHGPVGGVREWMFELFDQTTRRTNIDISS